MDEESRRPLLGASSTRTFPEKASVQSWDSAATSEELAAVPEKKASWWTAGLLIVADVIGSGILSLPASFAVLGWVVSLIFTFFFAIVNAHAGLYVYEAYSYYPFSLNFSDLASHTFGKAGRVIVAILTYMLILFVLGAYLVTLAQTAAMVFYQYEICSVWWSVVAAAELIPLMQMRTLHSLWFLLWLNLLFITLAVLIALITFTVQGQEETLKSVNGTAPVAIGSDLDVFSFYGAMGTFAFAYVGCFIFVEIISEMKDSTSFPSALTRLATPMTLSYYLVVSCWGYAYLGTGASGNMILSMPKGPAYVAAALFLHVHMLITFVVKGTIITRFFHRKIHLESINEENFRGRGIYFGCSVLTVLICWFIGNLVPFFEDLVSLIGALFIPFLGFLIPYAFLLKARAQHGKQTPIWELAFIIVMSVFMLSIWGLGTYSSVASIAEKWQQYGAPFSCTN